METLSKNIQISTLYYITLVTMPLDVSTLLRHPQGIVSKGLPSYMRI
jgi:hypothetical protein